MGASIACCACQHCIRDSRSGMSSCAHAECHPLFDTIITFCDFSQSALQFEEPLRAAGAADSLAISI